MTSTVYDPVEIEGLIAARLEATIQQQGLVKRVYRTKEYKDVGPQSQIVPSLVVIYNGIRPVEQLARGAVTAVDLDYIVVVVVRSSKDTLRGTDAKEKAASIFFPTLMALVNWKPAPGTGRFTMAEGPPADYDDAGLSYLPLIVTTRVTLTPTP